MGRARRLRPEGFPWTAPTWPVSVDRAAPERHLGADYDTDGPAATPPAWCGPWCSTTSPVPSPTSWRHRRCAATRSSSSSRPPPSTWPTTPATSTPGCCCRCCRPGCGTETVVAAAADHFFDRRWKAHVWSLVLAAVPIERHRVNRKSAEDTAALLREGWNLDHLPRGRPVPRRLVPGHAGRRRLSRHAHGEARGPRPHRRHLPDLAPGRQTPAPESRPASPSARPSRRPRVKTPAGSRPGSTACWRSWPTSRVRTGGRARRRAGAGETPSARGPEASPWRRAWALGPDPHRARRGRRDPLGTGRD